MKQIAKVIKDVGGLDFTVVALTDGNNEKPKDTDTKVVLEVGGRGVNRLLECQSRNASRTSSYPSPGDACFGQLLSQAQHLEFSSS